jgi:hypothetical protein
MGAGFIVPDKLPFHCLNKYSPAGVATMETTAPFSNALVGGETVPPFKGVQSTVSFCWRISLEQEKKAIDKTKT